MVWDIRSEQTYYAVTPLAKQAHRQLVTYWRVRIAKTLEEFESQARRMLALEHSLNEFTVKFCDAVAPLLAPLLKQGIGLQEATSKAQLPAGMFEWAELNMNDARASEMKSRFRRLAKEIHPDACGDKEITVTIDAIGAAYHQQDLARLMRLQAELLMPGADAPSDQVEDYVRQVEAAAATYRKAYTELLHAPVYAIYSRACCAQSEGWNWLEDTVKRAARLLAQLKQEAA